MFSIGLRGPQWSCDPTTNGFEGSGQESDYITNQSGQVVTKTTMDEGVMTWDYTNVYADGQLFATYDAQGLHFQLNDWLGTRRVTTDYAGVVEETCASLPYGSGLNCSGSEYAPNEQHFTGKTHDAESGLDYFGARYYSENDARFMSPDWSAKVEPVPYAKLDNPQSLNLYDYMLDSPLDGVDQDGHFTCGGGNAGSLGCRVRAAWNEMHQVSASAWARSGFNVAQQQVANGTTSIQTVSATSAAPAMLLGGIVGEGIDPAGGGVAGALLGSTIGVGGSVSYVPSTDSWFAGPTVTFSPVLLSGTGASASDVIVPSGQNPNSIANGQSYSVTLQPTPLTGTTVVKSPGSGPPVAGPSIGTKVPVAFGASYNFNITPAVNAVKSFVNNAIQTMESWF